MFKLSASICRFPVSPLVFLLLISVGSVPASFAGSKPNSAKPTLSSLIAELKKRIEQGRESFKVGFKYFSTGEPLGPDFYKHIDVNLNHIIVFAAEIQNNSSREIEPFLKKLYDLLYAFSLMSGDRQEANNIYQLLLNNPDPINSTSKFKFKFKFKQLSTAITSDECQYTTLVSKTIKELRQIELLTQAEALLEKARQVTDVDQKTRLIEESIQASPDSPFIPYRATKLMLDLRNYPRCYEYLYKLLAIEPSESYPDAAITWYRAWANIQLGYLEEIHSLPETALSHYSDAMDLALKINNSEHYNWSLAAKNRLRKTFNALPLDNMIEFYSPPSNPQEAFSSDQVSLENARQQNRKQKAKRRRTAY